MFQRHRGKPHKQIYLCLPFSVGKHREPHSINPKLFLPIIPIGIVAYAFTLLWGNLCRNSCMHNNRLAFEHSEIDIHVLPYVFPFKSWESILVCSGLLAGK